MLEVSAEDSSGALICGGHDGGLFKPCGGHRRRSARPCSGARRLIGGTTTSAHLTPSTGTVAILLTPGGGGQLDPTRVDARLLAVACRRDRGRRRQWVSRPCASRAGTRPRSREPGG